MTTTASLEFVSSLQWALAYVKANGFGSNVDADDIIELAAVRYLEQIES